MKVKLLDPNLEIKVQGDPPKILKGGMIYDLDDNVARRLIESNYAVEVEETEAAHESENA